MPRYDYKCVDCKTEFELRQSFAEAGKGVCPNCSGAGQRVFHAVPVIYKGSGFYTTDYGRPKRPVENGSKDSSESKSKSGETNSSGSKESASTESTASSSSSGGSASGSSESKSEPAAKAASDSTSST